MNVLWFYGSEEEAPYDWEPRGHVLIPNHSVKLPNPIIQKRNQAASKATKKGKRKRKLHKIGGIEELVNIAKP